MIFKMIKTESVNGGFSSGVALFEEEDSMPKAVIVKGIAQDDAYFLYSKLNQALVDSGLAVQKKNKAANDTNCETTEEIKRLRAENAFLKKVNIRYGIAYKYRWIIFASWVMLIVQSIRH